MTLAEYKLICCKCNDGKKKGVLSGVAPRRLKMSVKGGVICFYMEITSNYFNFIQLSCDNSVMFGAANR